MIRAMLEVLYEETRELDFDVVLMTSTTAALAASQSVRRQIASDGSEATADPWSDLDQQLRDSADSLAAHAARGNLVLFLGAGTSAAAGLPTWATLLQSLATNAGMNADELKALERLPGIDRARIIQGRLIAEGLDMGKIIADQLRTDQCPLADSLLAALPIREAATMNYDTLFESAARALGSPVAVLPYEAAASGERWLLKMHGCV